MYAAFLLVFLLVAASAHPTNIPPECMREFQESYHKQFFLSKDQVKDHKAIIKKVLEQLDFTKCMNMKIRVVLPNHDNGKIDHRSSHDKPLRIVQNNGYVYLIPSEAEHSDGNIGYGNSFHPRRDDHFQRSEDIASTHDFKRNNGNPYLTPTVGNEDYGSIDYGHSFYPRRGSSQWKGITRPQQRNYGNRRRYPGAPGVAKQGDRYGQGNVYNHGGDWSDSKYEDYDYYEGDDAPVNENLQAGNPLKYRNGKEDYPIKVKTTNKPLNTNYDNQEKNTDIYPDYPDEDNDNGESNVNPISKPHDQIKKSKTPTDNSDESSKEQFSDPTNKDVDHKIKQNDPNDAKDHHDIDITDSSEEKNDGNNATTEATEGNSDAVEKKNLTPQDSKDTIPHEVTEKNETAISDEVEEKDNHPPAVTATQGDIQSSETEKNDKKDTITEVPLLNDEENENLNPKGQENKDVKTDKPDDHINREKHASPIDLGSKLNNDGTLLKGVEGSLENQVSNLPITAIEAIEELESIVLPNKSIINVIVDIICLFRKWINEFTHLGTCGVL